MAEKFDTQQVVAFLRRTGEELRKTGEELRDEAQRLLAEVRDPGNQQRVKDSIQELGNWFRRTTGDATDRIEHAVKKAEETLRVGAERVRKTATHVAGQTGKAGGKTAARAAAAGKRAGVRKGKKKAAPRSGSGRGSRGGKRGAKPPTS